MNRIKEILKEQGVTINELADKLGISRVTLSTQINGTANIVSYEKIATALNVPMWHNNREGINIIYNQSKLQINLSHILVTSLFMSYFVAKYCITKYNTKIVL